MSRIKVIADSTSDIPSNEVAEFDIDIVSLTITLDQKTYKESVDITSSEFFDLLVHSKDFPTTALAGPELFYEAYEKAVRDGYDSIVTITISKAASGTYQSAQIAKDMFLEKYPNFHIEVVDSQFLSYIHGYFAVEAARLAKRGASIKEILERIHYLQLHTEVYFVVDTLEYLRRGGRINMSRAIIGTLLDLKPILTIRDGLVEGIENVRGSKRLLPRLVQLLEKNKSDKDYEAVLLGHGNAPEKIEQLAGVLTKAFGITDYGVFRVGAVVGAHSGPGIVAVYVVNPAIENDWIDNI